MLRSWIQRWVKICGRSKNHSPRTNSSRRRSRLLTLEALENRLVPSTATHLLIDPVNGQPFAWQNEVPTDPSHVNVYYDFRSLNGFANLITPAEKARAVDALNMWSAATGGRLHFIQSTSAPLDQIIDIGTGDLRAIGAQSGTDIVGEGGVDQAYTDAAGHNVLHQGYAWLDFAQVWDTVIGNGNPVGTIDYFTVAAHEIGHALGLDHTDGLPGPSIMDAVIIGEHTGPSASDVSMIQSLYPPLQGSPTQSLALFAVGCDAGGAPIVRVFDGKTEKFEITAYDPNFTGGVRVAVGDVNGDGVPDIITAPSPGGGPDIHVYDGRTGELMRQFFAYDPHFTGGCYVAAGDVNGDGFADIVIGADAGGGPNVAVFSGRDNTVLQDFFAYDMHFTGGVRVAVGDVNGDGYGDLICGAGPGGGPNVTVFSGKDGTRLQSFFTYDWRFSAGIYVAGGDVDGDGRADIIAGSGAGGGPNVAVFRGTDDAPIGSFFPYDMSLTSGVRVGAARQLGSNRDLILTIPGPGGKPDIHIYNNSLTELDHFYAYDSLFLGGGFVAGNQ
jgi:Matrixin/FG-GAP-like repeat/FG-GAP repeat